MILINLFRKLIITWKLNVRTNSPVLVSLCLTKNNPWPRTPSWSTKFVASDLPKVPWNQNSFFKVCPMSVSIATPKTKTNRKIFFFSNDFTYTYFRPLPRNTYQNYYWKKVDRLHAPTRVWVAVRGHLNGNLSYHALVPPPHNRTLILYSTL